MNELKFFKCPVCKNLSVLVVDGKVPMMCCGQKMQHLVPNNTDASQEKHMPEIKVNADTLVVQAGSVIHPMSEEHHVAFIAVLFDDGTFSIKNLDVTQPPVAEFSIKGHNPVKVYEYCNLHGLWAKEV